MNNIEIEKLVKTLPRMVVIKDLVMIPSRKRVYKLVFGTGIDEVVRVREDKVSSHFLKTLASVYTLVKRNNDKAIYVKTT